MSEPWQNSQPTKDLTIFQRFVVQSHYIKQLNLWLDELSWENEKKDTIIEMKESEIECLKYLVSEKAKQFDDLKIEFEKLNKKYESVSSQKGRLLIRRGIFPK